MRKYKRGIIKKKRGGEMEKYEKKIKERGKMGKEGSGIM